MASKTTGPLSGVRVLEIQGMGPGPFATMILSDFGADVIRVDRADAVGNEEGDRIAALDVLARGRRSVALDLKRPAAVDLVLKLVDRADVLVEGYRPGVMERLGLGPGVCLERNPRLVYGRVTGWGQDGPWAAQAGHDINYIALAGTLWPIGRGGEAPVPPINYVGDFGGGGMLLALGICAALTERASSGRGQVVDAAMVDGAASLMTMIHSFHEAGLWNEERGANLLDTGAPWYDAYETSDGRYLAVGGLESRFYAELLAGMGLADDESMQNQNDRDLWPAMKKRFAAVIATKTRDEWTEIFDGTDACAVPVLSPWEAPLHPHNQARSTFVEVDGRVQPAPAPRFSRTPSTISRGPSFPGADTVSGLVEWGIDEGTVATLREKGALS
jgi:alpha-methylacyl-CoA racemase